MHTDHFIFKIKYTKWEQLNINCFEKYKNKIIGFYVFIEFKSLYHYYVIKRHKEIGWKKYPITWRSIL